MVRRARLRETIAKEVRLRSGAPLDLAVSGAVATSAPGTPCKPTSGRHTLPFVALFRLIYVSRVARPTRLADVEEIVTLAAQRNAADDITGLLVYSPSHFLQALEGEDVQVRRTYERIRRDARHTNARVLDASAASERWFSTWAMTARPYSGPTSRELEQLTLERAIELLRTAAS